MSPHKLTGGKIGLKFTSLQRFVKISLIFLFAATPPATTKILFLLLLIFLNSLKAILLFLYNISSTVFWNEAARSYFSWSVLIFLAILSTAVLRPAKDKLHPPLCIIGLGNSYFFGLPFFANSSIFGPPGNSIPSNFAVLSKASPTASSIVVPNLLYLPKPWTLKNWVWPPET